MGLIVVLLVLLAVLSGCIHSDLERVEPGPDDEPAEGQRVEVGDEVTTREGDLVTVHRVADGEEVEGSDLLLVDAEVEICAAADGDGAPAAPQFFRAVVADEGLRRPGPAGKQPALPAGRLEAGDCARGWVGFPIEPDEQVEAIALLASSTVEWALE
jgi:hypothetical protein